MNLPFYIARRLYAGNDEMMGVGKPAVKIAILGTAIGIATMIVSICVVLGFKHAIRDKVVGFGGHIVVSNYMTLQTSDQTQPVNANDSLYNEIKKIEGVRHVQRYTQKQGVLKTDSDFLGVMFKGVGEDFDSTFIAANIIKGKMPKLSMAKSTQQLLISKTMADKLQLTVGGKVYAYFLGDDEVRARPFTVTGIYRTNMSKYDEAICFSDLYTISRLNGWQSQPEEGKKIECTGMELSVCNFDSIDAIEDVIINKVNKTCDSDGNPLSSLTIQELSPQIFSWLDLLDLNVWVILVLMICVAGFTMISGLLIIILERTSMIGLMKALGARNSVVRKTFRWLALQIVLKGMFWGNVLGIGICLIQQYTGLVELDPTVYYVTEAPVEIDIPLILLLNVASLAISVAVLVLPSYFVSHIEPAKSMRYE